MSVHCCLVVTCWERADLLALVGDVYCIFVTFPCGFLGQVWYWIVSFPDLCRLSYLNRHAQMSSEASGLNTDLCLHHLYYFMYVSSEGSGETAWTSGHQIRVCIGKLFSLFLIENICCGYSKEPSQWDDSFEHPKHMFKLIGKKIITILHSKNFLIWTYGCAGLSEWLLLKFLLYGLISITYKSCRNSSTHNALGSRIHILPCGPCC